MKVSPPLPLALLHLKLGFKPGGVKVRFTKPIQGSLTNARATTFGYFIAVAGVARSVDCDATKIVKVIFAILAVYWTRLLAAALVNVKSFDAHPDLPKIGDGGGLLWLTLRTGRICRVRLYEVVLLRIFVRVMQLAVNDRLDVRGRHNFVGNGRLFVTSLGRASKTVHTLRTNG